MHIVLFRLKFFLAKTNVISIGPRDGRKATDPQRHRRISTRDSRSRFPRGNPRRKIENFAASVVDEYREKAIWESRDGFVPWMQHVQTVAQYLKSTFKNIKVLSRITNIKKTKLLRNCCVKSHFFSPRFNYKYWIFLYYNRVRVIR